MDIARLGLAVDSSQVEKGTASLHQLTGAAGQASAAAQRLTGATTAEAAAHQTATAATLAHNAALNAQQAVMRSTAQQRTMMIYQLNDIGVSLASGMNPALVAVQQGSQILQGGFAPALKTISDLATGLATKFWPVAVAVGAVTATFAGLTYEINKTADTQVSIIDVMLAAWGMFADQVGAIVGPVWAWIVDGLKWVWDQMAPILKNIGNGIIRPFAFGVEAIGVLWQRLPAAIGDAMITTANVILKGIEWSINGATRLLNGFLEKYNEGLSAMGQKAIPLGTGIAIPQASNPYQGALGQLGQGLEGASLNAGNTDYMGDFFDDLSGRAQEIALARAEVDALGESVGAANDNLKAANDNIWGMTDALGALGPASIDPLTMLRSQMTDLDGLLAQGKISWEQYGEAAFRANSGAASSVLGLASGVTGALAQMFQDNKAFAIANAVVSTAESVMKALATYGPTPWGFAAAGVAAAAGAAQIGAIMSASPGGGGSVRTPAAAPTQQNAPQRVQAESSPERMDITLHGLDRNAMYSGDNIESFLRAIEARAADGRILNIKVA